MNRTPIEIITGLNPAKYPALLHAQNRANREGKACAVYLAGPNAKQVFTPTYANVWYVRLLEEPAPEGAQLYVTIEPESKLQL